MSFDYLRRTGAGSIRYRLEVEGWPVEWVTDTSITHADNADGRFVRGGLQYDGLRMRERVVLHEASIECDPITFKIVPMGKIRVGTLTTDEATYYLSRTPDPTDRLAADLAFDDTTMAALTSGGSLPDGSVWQIGTETIRVTTWPNIERAIWGSQPQGFVVSSYNRAFDIYLYRDLPPTMEGRRCTLWAYDSADDPAGDGALVWRGIIARVPYRDSDGITWCLEADHRVAQLNQNVAGGIAEAHVIGINHHQACGFAYQIQYGSTQFPVVKVFGHHSSEAEMLTVINGYLSSILVDVPGFFDSIQLAKTDEGLQLIAQRSSASSAQFAIVLGSPILGWAHSVVDGWNYVDTGVVKHIPGWDLTGSIGLEADKTYWLTLARTHPQVSSVDPGWTYNGAPVHPLGYANMMVDGVLGRSDFSDTNDVATNYPPWRIFVDTDVAGADVVYISGTAKPDGMFTVLGAGNVSGKYYVDVQEWGAPLGSGSGQVWVGNGWQVTLAYQKFLGFLGSETVLQVQRDYGLGDISIFVLLLKSRARDHANEGDTPFLTNEDLGYFSPARPLQPVQGLRQYRYSKSIRVGEILQEEAKFINHFMRLDLDGLLGLAPLPRWSNATPVDALHTIDRRHIIAPENGVGAWPTWTPNRDGRVTQVDIWPAYRSDTGESIGGPLTVQDTRTIAVTKGRGKSPMEIKPKSWPLFPGVAVNAILTDIAREYLAFAATDYDVVTLPVTYEKWDILCGDIVSLTHDLILSGDGYYGVAGRRGVVIEKRVGLDPARTDRIDLTILLTPKNLVGYAPSALLTDWTNTTGNTWVIKAGADTSLNVAFSALADGKCMQHFGVGDNVVIYQIDLSSIVPYFGAVTAVNYADDEITVELDVIWSPGDPEEGDNWLLEHDNDDGDGTANQRVYAQSSTSGGAAPDGGFARRFS